MTLPKWINSDGKIVTEIDNSLHGFVYIISYSDGKMYIGKKNFYSNIVKPSLKTKDHNGCTKKTFKFVYRNDNGSIVTSKKRKKELKKQGIKPKKEYYDECIVESNWRAYIGSSDEAKAKKDMIVQRKIISFHTDSKNLSYWENYELFNRNVLLYDTYINDNIGGSFYRNQIKENNGLV